MDLCGVKDRNIEVTLTEQHSDLGTAEDHAIDTFTPHGKRDPRLPPGCVLYADDTPIRMVPPTPEMAEQVVALLNRLKPTEADPASP